VLEALSSDRAGRRRLRQRRRPHDPSLARERVVTVGGVTIHVSHGHELGQPTPQLALAAIAATS
jgi:hypothetical protein